MAGGRPVSGRTSWVLDCTLLVPRIVALGSFALALASCGGGGGGSEDAEDTPGLPFISASLVSFPAGSVPAGFNANASVEVFDGFGMSRGDASVTINGQ